MGVASIDLLVTELGEKSYQDTTLLVDGGAEQALIEGAIQSRDTTLPLIATYPSLRAWLAAKPWERDAEPATLFLAPDNERSQGAFAELPCQPGAAAVLVIGSERGWSESERSQLEAAGFLRLSMGSRALRTETACVAAAILALEKIGALR